jgi:hypothetical protein
MADALTPTERVLEQAFQHMAESLGPERAAFEMDVLEPHRGRRFTLRPMKEGAASVSAFAEGKNHISLDVEGVPVLETWLSPKAADDEFRRYVDSLLQAIVEGRYRDRIRYLGNQVVWAKGSFELTTGTHHASWGSIVALVPLVLPFVGRRVSRTFEPY